MNYSQGNRWCKVRVHRSTNARSGAKSDIKLSGALRIPVAAIEQHIAEFRETSQSSPYCTRPPELHATPRSLKRQFGGEAAETGLSKCPCLRWIGCLAASGHASRAETAGGTRNLVM